MKHITKSLVLASAVAAIAGAAHAETARVTFVADRATVSPLDYQIGDLQGSGTLNFSELLLGALSIANITTSAVAPGQLIETADTLAVAAPLLALSGQFDRYTNEFTAQSVRTGGGALMTASALTSNGKKNAATTGGSLSVTNIKVDLTSQGIYATLTGANGVGTQNNVLVWHFGAIEGATTLSLTPSRFYGFAEYELSGNVQNTLSELTITDNAFDLFAQSLGLTAFGRSAMASITDYGTMTAEAEITLPPMIPEPSSYMLMGLGLVGIAIASRRASRA